MTTTIDAERTTLEIAVDILNGDDNAPCIQDGHRCVLVKAALNPAGDITLRVERHKLTDGADGALDVVTVEELKLIPGTTVTVPETPTIGPDAEDPVTAGAGADPVTTPRPAREFTPAVSAT